MTATAPCEHLDFAATVTVNRLTQVDGGPVTGYSADIRVSCEGCGEPFDWIGLSVGLSPRLPMASLDGHELRAPLRPASAAPGFGLAGPGFSVRLPRSTPPVESPLPEGFVECHHTAAEGCTGHGDF